MFQVTIITTRLIRHRHALREGRDRVQVDVRKRWNTCRNRTRPAFSPHAFQFCLLFNFVCSLTSSTLWRSFGQDLQSVCRGCEERGSRKRTRRESGEGGEKAGGREGGSQERRLGGKERGIPRCERWHALSLLCLIVRFCFRSPNEVKLLSTAMKKTSFGSAIGSMSTSTTSLSHQINIQTDRWLWWDLHHILPLCCIIMKRCNYDETMMMISSGADRWATAPDEKRNQIQKWGRWNKL